MDSFDKETILKELSSVRNNVTEDKTKEQLVVLRFSKKIVHDINLRSKYQDKLFNLDADIFSKTILNSYNFEKIKDLYNDFILNKKKRYDYIYIITSKTTISKERLTKWSTKRLETKVISIQDKENKEEIMKDLESYGDGITNLSTPLNIQKQRLNFLKSKGITDNHDERFDLTKKLSHLLKKANKRVVYKTLMTEELGILKSELKNLQKDYHKDTLISYLVDHEYDIKFLKKQKMYVLEYLKSDLQPCEKGSRTELIRSLAAKNIWSRNTIRNWDIEKLKNAYIKNVQDIYSPLSEYIPNRPLTKSEKEKLSTRPQHPRLNKTREEILKDITETLFFDIVC